MDYVYQICRFACSYTKTEHHPLIKSKIRILSKTKTFPISRQEEFQACLKRNVLKLCQIKRNYLINYFFVVDHIKETSSFLLSGIATFLPKGILQPILKLLMSWKCHFTKIRIKESNF